MYENEKSNLKAYFESVMEDRNMHFIYIKPNDYSYLYEMTEALKNKEFLAIYGDRFVPGTQTMVKKFLGHDAEFALGHLHLACKHGVPVSYVSLVKTGTTTYHLNATKPKLYNYPSSLVGRKEVISSMLDDYINEIERVLSLYPLQWFNYYKFWKDSPKN
ncbi:MAG: hypothetical protein IPO21_15150 [Bacteroidales bacterium]|nr:hypothetical protein [Bacteroidales bacterium]